jgi:hypothetical protein
MSAQNPFAGTMKIDPLPEKRHRERACRTCKCCRLWAQIFHMEKVKARRTIDSARGYATHLRKQYDTLKAALGKDGRTSDKSQNP